MENKQIELSSGQTVKMREPMVRDLRAVANINSQTDQEMRLIGNLIEMSDAELDKMPARDYMRLQEALKDFLS